MAVQHQSRPMIAFLLFLLITFQQSTARPMAGFPAPKESKDASPLELFGYHPPRARPCDMASEVTTESSSSSSKQKLLRRYGPLLFNVLPRAPTPPSGPSGGTNENNN